jgi:hypothetical protein
MYHLGNFGTPTLSGLQLPKWELTWEWECSFFHTLLHSQPPGSTKCDFWASLLVRTLASPCLGPKPKARVATVCVFVHRLNLVEITCLLLIEHGFNAIPTTICNSHDVPIGLGVISHEALEVWIRNTLIQHHLVQLSSKDTLNVCVFKLF